LGNFFKAVAAFFNVLAHQSCHHTGVQLQQPAGKSPMAGVRCTHCGYKIKLVWVMLKCHGCSAKRHPKPAAGYINETVPIDTQFSALTPCCRHCGSSGIKVSKRDAIDAHDLPYALLLKEVDYRDEVEPDHVPAMQPTLTSPAKATYTPASVAYKQPTAYTNDMVTGSLLNVLEGYASPLPYPAPLSTGAEIFEGEVLRHRYVSNKLGKVWQKTDPFSWQARIEDAPAVS
jgi:hypothetical protein